MRGTITGLIAASALLAGCSRDNGTKNAEPSLLAENGVAIQATRTLPAPEPPRPVDAATAKAAWKEGVGLFENGDYRGAAEKLGVAAAGRPKDAESRYLLGLSLWKSGDPKAGETALVACVTLDPGRCSGWINLARVRHELSDRTGALDASEKALEIDPTSAAALHQKGRALMELKRGDEALEALKTAHDLDPDDGYVANTYGLLLIQLGKPADAIAPLEIAKSRLPHVAYVRNNLGVAYERTGRVDEAKLEYQAAVDSGDLGGKAMRSLVRLGATDTTASPTIALSANGE